MATDQETPTRDATLRPQTPAARRRNPEAASERTTEERERLREESRARRRARAEGRMIAPEPPGDQITLRRLPEATAEAIAAPPAAPPEASEPPTAAPPVPPEAPPAPRSGPARMTPAANRLAPAPPPPAREEPPREEAPHDEPPHDDRAREQAPREETVRDETVREEAPHDEAAHNGAAHDALVREPAEPEPVHERRQPVRRQAARGPWLDALLSAKAEIARQPWAEALRKSWPENLPQSLPEAFRSARRSVRSAVVAPPKPAAPPREPVEAWPERETLFEREPALAPEPAAAPPAQPPASHTGPAAPDLPASPRERALALLGIACAFGAVIALALTLGSGSLPGFGGGFGAHVKGNARVVAPGGWVTLRGQHASGGAKVLLESRGKHENWHFFAQGTAGSDGDFAIKGRVLERPGRVQLRARVPGGAATDPIPVIVRPLRLAAVGDVNLDGAPANAWQGVGAALRHADISFANLESAVSTRGLPYLKQYNFRVRPAALAKLRRVSGLDVLNLANNHVGDYGPGALMDTVNAVRRDGMAPVGAGRNLSAATRPTIVTRLGLRIAFVGFSEIAPTDFAAGPRHPGTSWADPAQIAKSVRAARSRADIVVASFHWGIEGQTLETAQQRALADVAVQNGAQLVVGAHPHTLQPVRRQGGAIVAYSLGNFVFDGQSPPTTTTGILQLDLTADGVTRASWRAAHIAGGRPFLNGKRAKRLPMRDALRMQAGVNLPQL